MKNYFENCHTIEDLKKEYRKLAFQFHPDITKDDGEIMKEINNQYDEATIRIGKELHKNYSIDNEFKDIITALIKLKMENVTIEICGIFIWLTGNTKPYCKELGKDGLGLHWANKKKAWYWKPSWYYMVKHEEWDLNKIRSVYGSTSVKQDQQNDLVYA